MIRHELVTGPTDPVVPLSAIKQHLRVDHDDEDELIEAFTDAATQMLDGPSGILGIALAPQTWRAVFSEGEDVHLPLGPVISQADPVTADGEVTVEYVAGFAEVPFPIRAAIMLHVGTLYAERQLSAETWNPTRIYDQLIAPWRKW